MEQFELSSIMIDLGKSTSSYYLNLIIQFGYVSMFMSIFPAAVTYGFLSNMMMIILTEKAYSTIARRSLSRPIESIGVWNKIIEVMCFISTIVNAMLNVYTSNHLKEEFGGNEMKTLLIVIIAEHLIILFKFTLARLIPDVPFAIRMRLKNAKYLQNKAKEKRNNLKRRKKLKKVFSKIKTADRKNLHGFENFFKDMTLKSLPLELFVNKATAQIEKKKKKKSGK